MLTSTLCLIGGFALVAFVIIDQLRTVLLPGAGPLTHLCTSVLWTLTRRLTARLSSDWRHRVLRWAGPALYLATLGLWIACIWFGWTLVWCVDRHAVLDAETRAPVDAIDRFYYVGYIMVTLTQGRYAPGDGAWPVLTTLVSAHGFFTITLSISYLLGITSAVTHKRQVALRIASLGRTADDLVLRFWHGDGFDGLDAHLRGLAPDIAALTQQYYAYPILHYFHSPSRSTAAAPMLAVLDEALTVLLHVVGERHRLVGGSDRALRGVITTYLSTLDAAYISPADAPPPDPPIAPLRAAGIETVDGALSEARLRTLAPRRRYLRALVQDDGWSWEAVCRSETARDLAEADPSRAE